MFRQQVAYYQGASGTSPVEEFLDGLGPKPRAKCVSYIDLLEERGLSLPRTYLAKVEADMWELRPEYANVEYRLLLTHVAGHFVIVHAFEKKSDRIPQRHLKTARTRIKEVQDYYAFPDRQDPSPVRRRTT